MHFRRHWVEAVFVLETGDATILVTPSHRAVVPNPKSISPRARISEALMPYVMILVTIRQIDAICKIHKGLRDSIFLLGGTIRLLVKREPGVIALSDFLSGGGTTTRRVEQLRVGDLIVCIGGPARLEFVAEIPGRFEVPR